MHATWQYIYMPCVRYWYVGGAELKVPGSTVLNDMLVCSPASSGNIVAMHAMRLGPPARAHIKPCGVCNVSC